MPVIASDYSQESNLWLLTLQTSLESFVSILACNACKVVSSNDDNSFV